MRLFRVCLFFVLAMTFLLPVAMQRHWRKNGCGHFGSDAGRWPGDEVLAVQEKLPDGFCGRLYRGVYGDVTRSRKMLQKENKLPLMAR